MHIIPILFPVISIVLLGYFYARKYHPDMEAANALMLRVFVPALAFDVVSSGDFQLLTYKWLMLGGVIVILGSGLLAWPIGRALGYPMRAFLPNMMFNNCGNVGIPIALLAFGEHALPAAVVLFLISNFGHFTLGIYIFGGVVSWKGLVTSPVNVATILALIINLAEIQLPKSMLFPITMLGQIVIPLMLFSLGVRMLKIRIDHWKIGLVGGLVCPLTGLVFAYIATRLLPLDEFQGNVLILFAALPPAVLNFLISERYKQQPEMVASLVLVGNVLSAFVLSVVLWWLL